MHCFTVRFVLVILQLNLIVTPCHFEEMNHEFFKVLILRHKTHLCYQSRLIAD